MKPTKKPRVAFLGLGLMGSGMAYRLIAAGFPVAVYNRDRQKAIGHGRAGARVANTPREATVGANVAISMVADDDAARAIWFGKEGALAGLDAGAIAIESSTVTPAWIDDLTISAAASAIDVLDAPVTGSRPQAASGDLKFLVGGNEAVFKRAVPVLEQMGRTIVRVGDSGSGAQLKLINNFLCGVHVAALAEAFALIDHSGLDRATALAVLTQGAAGSPIVAAAAGRMAAAQYDPNFYLNLMVKDLTYVMKWGDDLSLRLATARTARRLFRRSIVLGDGNRDLSAIVEQLSPAGRKGIRRSGRRTKFLLCDTCRPSASAQANRESSKVGV
ncbi:MAG: NAD(P)-dependent oxidoreductase [Lacunisphaera sp.]